MSGCPDEIKRLIERFDQQTDRLCSPDYSEALLRVDFVQPFFTALGWDMDNTAGHAEQYREVVHEDKVRVYGQTKAPDYSFRVGGVRKFFVEAKKPAVQIKENWEPAYQLRRYGWSAKLPVSMLTNFAELAVYDCRIQPRQLEKASVARREYLRHGEYESRWDFLAATFSREAVYRGDFDRYCEAKKGRGAQAFDDAFLADIEKWRMELANNLTRRNPELDQTELNFAVQRIMDRIIFLRIAEDRGTEAAGQLQELASGSNVYAKLRTLFERADERYNSGLFYFAPEKGRSEQPDSLTPRLTVDDKTLKDIVLGLYYPLSPYEFSVVTADILGSIYERFLGKVITLSPGRRATVVEKPEVRKAGGVYYTPAYIVDYIVSNTVGRLLEGRTPREAAGLKVLDPACGSGSFLIGAYQSLLDWYLEQYLARGDAARLVTARKAVLRPTVTGGYALSIAERKRILLDHIHGVDIDSQAVEVTKLNLLLKCLEGETAVTLGFEQKLFRDRALPDLGQNILCGNSLIGTDIVGSNAWRQMSEQEQVRVNPFDYERSFAQVFNRRERGFDVVIGNPPYGAEFDLHSADCLRARHGDVLRTLDSYAIFMLDSRRWLQANGLLSFIVPTGWYSGDHFSLLRQEIIRAFDPLAFVNLPYDIFQDAWVDTTVFVLRLRGMPREFPVSGPLAVSLKSFPKRHKIIKAKEIVEGATVADCARWFQQGNNVFLTYSDDASSVIIEKMMRASSPLSHYADIQRGITPFIYVTKHRGKAHGERAFTGTVRRYALTHGEESWVRYDETLSEYKPQRYFTGRRILLREIISRQFRLQAVIATEDFITNKSMQSILVRRAKPGVPFFLGIINSKLLSWYFLQRSNVGQRDDFPKIVLKETRSLPIPIAHAEPSADSPKAKKLSVLTESMLGLHRRLAAEKHPQRVEQIQREIEAVDRQIDQLVYELYGLTEEEIRIVEESTA